MKALVSRLAGAAVKRSAAKAARGLKVSAELNQDSKGVLHMFEHTMSKRLVKFREQLAYQSAESLRTAVLAKIPNKADLQPYRQSLKVAQITGTPLSTTGYAVIGKPKKQSLRTLDPELTLVYVKPSRQLRTPNPLVEMLVEFSPWTMGTLPLTPKRGEGLLSYRRVTKREVLQVETRRKKDRRKWEQSLRKKGALRSKAQQNATKLNGPIRQDLAFTALRLEYGQGSSPAKPHWRPAVANLKRIAIPNMRNSSDLNRAVADPNFQAWQQWPKQKTSLKIPARVAKTLGQFQKKLKVKW